VPSLPSRFTLAMPEWFDDEAAALPDTLATVAERMAVVHRMARRNVDERTGGPFAAGVFEQASGRVVALGVNRVVPEGISCAHAETMALSLAQTALGTWDLGGPDLPAHQLVVNWRPCAMCFGSVLWSGVAELVVAGEGPLVEEITGFDEGPIHPEWREQLAARGIALQVGVGHDDAVATFEAYRASGAPVYNGRGGAPA
jgi:tRNA(Arg) A34 adenosine deaminase TadA